MSVGALAETIEHTDPLAHGDGVKKEVNVTASIEETWQVTIPADVELSSEESYEAERELKVENVLIDPSHTLTVTLKASENSYSDGTFNLIENSTEKKLPYTIKKGGNQDGIAIGDNEELINISKTNIKKEETIKLGFKADPSNLEVAGDYADQLTFTVICDAAE